MLLRVVAFILMLSVAQAPTAPQAGKADPDLKRGIAQVREGDFASAVLTLDDLARRLAHKSDQPSVLARTYVYLSIAYLGLSQVEAARAAFLEALETDDGIELTPEEFPPRFLTFFEETMKVRDAAGTAASGEPETEDARASGPVEVVPRPQPGKSSSKKWLVLAGAGAAAGAGIALAGGGGGGGGEAEAPVVTPETPLLTTYFSSVLSCHNPFGHWNAFPVYHPGTIQATLNWLESDADIEMNLCQMDPTYRYEFLKSTPTGPTSAALTFYATELGTYRVPVYWKDDCWTRDGCTCPTATYTITVRHP